MNDATDSRRIIAYELVKEQYPANNIFNSYFTFPNLWRLDTQSDPTEYYVLHITYKNETDEKITKSLRSQIEQKEIGGMPQIGFYGLYHTVRSAKNDLKDAENDLEKNRFGTFIKPWTAPSEKKISRFFDNYSFPAASIATIISGSIFAEKYNNKVALLTTGGIFALIALLEQISNYKSYRKARKYIDALHNHQEFSFYSQLMEFELPVQREFVPQAREFIGEVASKKDEYLVVDWNRVNKDLQRIYDLYLQKSLII